ncbi:MAG TPA: carbohydrate porin [Casimicrobiaceae bacterium]|jgi:high affinity Mn2+ porin|nr:carbohydrate porin [Casimicrobiaceae bacterium]
MNKREKFYVALQVAVMTLIAAVDCGKVSAADTSGALGLPREDAVPVPSLPQASAEDKEAGLPGPSSDWPQLVGAQYTWIRQFQSSLSSPYQGPNSLNPDGDAESTHTVGVYFGWAVSRNLQAYLDIEKFMGAGVSNAVGMGGLSNGDVVRQGGAGLRKRPYVARRYLRYMVPLGDQVTELERSQDQIAGKEAARRLEFKLGTMALSDDFDKNRYANTTRTQFMNWALWNNAAWDFAADTRGYTNGLVAGYVSPQWSLKAGLFQMPAQANGQDLDAPLRKARGENVELTLAPNGAGAVIRLLAYRNVARMGIYRDALAVAAAAGMAPDIAAQDRDGRKKYGFGLNIEQPLADAGETGLFLRAGWNDGKTETFAFTEVDRTLTFGAQIAGSHWGRESDRLAAAIAVNGLSADHKDYLAAGGAGFMLGDGRINYDSEQIFEAYYRVQIGKYGAISIQLSPDFQYVRNPGYNSDRGPVRVASFRLHLEY